METGSQESLRRLAALIHERNQAEAEMSRIIQRPAHPNYVGEFVAARVFGIQLDVPGAGSGYHGVFQLGPLEGSKVSVRFTAQNDGTLDLNADAMPEYYLILSGPWTEAGSPRGKRAPWQISQVFLFNARELVSTLRKQGYKVGVATAVPTEIWEAAQVYPQQTTPLLLLTDVQRELLDLFPHP